MAYPIIDRKDQLEQIQKAISEAKNGRHFKALEYSGIGGQGKSSILNIAKEQCRKDKIVFSAIDFAGSPKASEISFLFNLCDQLEHYFPFAKARSLLGIQYGQAANLMEHNTENNRDQNSAQDLVLSDFQELLIKALDSKPLVLMFDSIERCEEPLFDWIGERFLAPMVIGKMPQLSVVLFLAGRGPKVHESQWSRKLRLNVESYPLDPLDFASTELHLSNLPPAGRYKPIAKQIYAMTNGHPYSTQTLVKYLHQFNVPIDEIDGHKIQLAHQLHEEVVQRYILSHSVTPVETILPLLELASIVRKFDPGSLAHLDKKYRPNFAEDRTIQWYAVQINRLVSPLHLAFVGGSKPAYELDQTLRRILNATLVILNPERVSAIHKAAKALHEQELTKITLPNEMTVYLTLEILYHTTQLITIEDESKPIVNLVANELDNLLRRHYQSSELTDTLQALQLLKNLIDQDEDLLDLLERNGITKLKEHVKQFEASPSLQVPIELSHLNIEHAPPTGYKISWYHANELVLPTETVRSALQFKQDRWRENTERTGKTAFAAYFPPRAQEFVRVHKEWAIQIITNWTSIPWELLHDGEDFLCLSRPIARKPRILKEAQRHPQPKGGPLRALVIGNPTGDLPEAQKEAEAIIELLEKRNVVVDKLIKDKANATDFADYLTNRSYDLIHYAGHSYFDRDDPRSSGLVFNDNPVYSEELERYLKSPAFIFFSSCEAGESQPQSSTLGFRGEFIEGLATSALLGGANGCLGPMWSVEDGIACKFALEFYDNLLKKQPIGEAVRQARLKTYDHGTDFWASWVLYGDPLRQINI